MPGGDRTGPLGMGARTGRAAGFCAGNDAAGYENPAYGRGFGAGMGRAWGRGGVGRGFRRFGIGNRPWRGLRGGPGQAAPGQAEPSEARALSREAEALRSELEQIRQRLLALEAKKDA